MLTDGLQLLGNSTAVNFSIDSGAALPTDASSGELFLQTDVGLHVYDGTEWVLVGAGATVDSASIVAALGYTPAALENGKIAASQVPAMAITDTYVVATQAAMLGLTAETGDVAVRTDNRTTYILKADDATVLANWVQLLNPTSDVTSVNGQTGTVLLTTTGINEGFNLYYTNARARSAISVTGDGGSYNSTTGVITISPASASNFTLTNGTGGTGQVQYNANGVLTGSDKFIWTDASATLRLGAAGVASAIQGYDGGAAAGSGVTIRSGTGTVAGGVGSGMLIRAGQNSSSAANSTGGNTTIEGGAGYAADTRGGGHVFVTGGYGVNGIGGDVVLTGGTGNVAANHGVIRIHTNSAERFRISAAGGWSLGNATNNFGTSGQVLTSQGDAPPTWATPTAGAAAAGTLTGTSLANNVVNFTATTITGVPLNSSTAIPAPTMTILGGGGGGSQGQGGPIVIQAGASSANSGGGVTIQGGTGLYDGGDILIVGGSSNVTNVNGSFDGGSVHISGGRSYGGGGSQSGEIYFSTTVSSGAPTERFRINRYGALGIGSTPAYGTAGQVLTSGGSNAQPTWGDGGGVSSVSVTTANGVSGTVATATTTPAISLTLGNITPSYVTTPGVGISAAAGTYRVLWFQTNGAGRFNMHADNSAETGSSAGSVFNFVSIEDSGAQTILWSANRASKTVTFNSTVSLNGTNFVQGNMTVGHNTQPTTGGGANVIPPLGVTKVGASGDIVMRSVHTAASALIIQRANNNSGSPSVVVNGDILGGVYGSGYDGTDYQNAAAMQFVATRTYSASDRGSAILLATTPNASITRTERLRITPQGGVSFGATGTAYGTAGQVLTSTGDAPPTWSTPTAGAAAAGTLTGTTLATNVVTASLTGVYAASTQFRATGETTGTIIVGGSAGSGGSINGFDFPTSGSNALMVRGGASNLTTMAGGQLNLFGGNNSTTGASANGGAVQILGGGSGGPADGGIVTITGGTSSSGTAGSVTLSGGNSGSLAHAGNAIVKGGNTTGTKTAGMLTLSGGRADTQALSGIIQFVTGSTGGGAQRLAITQSGAISFGATTTAYGTAGQVLTSAGDAPPTWSTPAAAAAAAGTLTGTTLATNVVQASLQTVYAPSTTFKTTAETAGTIILGGNSGPGGLIRGFDLGTGAGAIAIRPGHISFSGTTGATLSLDGGTNMSTGAGAHGGPVNITGGVGSGGNGGSVTLAGAPGSTAGQGGNATVIGGTGTGANVGGNVSIGGGQAATAALAGAIRFVTGPAGTYLERFRVTGTGALAFGNNATAFGTAGQVLTSAGDAPPTWSTPTAAPYDISGAVLAMPAASAVVTRFVSVRTFTIPAGMTGSRAATATPATASTVLSVQKNGTQFGTITFAAGATTGTFAAASQTSFAAGDLITVVAPATPDATFNDAAFTIVGVL